LLAPLARIRPASRPSGAFTSGLQTGRSPFPPPDITTVATGSPLLVRLSLTGMAASVAAPDHMVIPLSCPPDATECSLMIDWFVGYQEEGSIHRAIQHKRGRDVIIAQPAYKSRCFPMAVWRLINEPFALRSPVRNALRAAATSGRSCSAACRLFLKVRLMWRRNLEIPDWLTFTFSFAKRT
jgi:hypothetical protein